MATVDLLPIICHSKYDCLLMLSSEVVPKKGVKKISGDVHITNLYLNIISLAAKSNYFIFIPLDVFARKI